MRITIKTALICGIILLQTVTLTTLLVSDYLSSQRSFSNHAQKLMLDYTDNVIASSKRFLDNAQATTRLTGELLSSDVLSIKRSNDLSLYFYQQLKQSPHLSGIYFAGVNGEFVHVQREQGFKQALFTQKFILLDESGLKKQSRLYTLDDDFTQLSMKRIEQENFDPRDRIWFNKALENNTLSWTDPYVFFSSRKPGITNSMPIYDRDNTLIGVIGVDISLATISSFFKNIDLGDNSTAFVTNRLGEVIAYPDQAVIQETANESLRFPRISELNNPTAQAAWSTLQEQTNLFRLKSSTTDISFTHNDKRYYALFQEFTHHKWPWLIAIYMPEEFFLAELLENQRMNIIFGLAISFIAVVASFFFIGHITDSLRKIKEIAQNIADGNLVRSNITDTTFVELQQAQSAFNGMLDSLIDSQQENKQLQGALEKTNVEVMTRLGIVAQYKNTTSPNHIERVSQYAELLAKTMGLSENKAKEIGAAAKLHDLGKIAVPEYILFKNGQLSSHEWQTIKSVPLMGSQILAGAESKTLICAYDIALTLHEHWDGNGYPNQLAGSQIPLAARIVAVVDTFDTMLHPCSYKPAKSTEDAVDEIRSLIGSKFDPAVITAFNQCLGELLLLNQSLSEASGDNKVRHIYES